jgi:hypothetical protein
MKRLLIPMIAALLCEAGNPTPAGAQAWSAPPAKDGHAYPDCYCSNRGARVEMGQITCLNVRGRSFTARCEMSLNSPAWREVEEGCAPAPSVRFWQRDQVEPG